MNSVRSTAARRAWAAWRRARGARAARRAVPPLWAREPLPPPAAPQGLRRRRLRSLLCGGYRRRFLYGGLPFPGGLCRAGRVLPHLLRLTFQNALGKLVCHEYDLPAGDYSLRARFPGIPRRIDFLLEVLFAYICANRTSRARTIITRRARAFRRQGTRSRRSPWSAGRRSRSARRPARSR